MRFSARQRLVAVGASALTGAVLAGAALAGGLPAGERAEGRKAARATLVGATGEAVGRVRFWSHGRTGGVTVSVEARRLAPGFHGFHLHGVGSCEPPTFSSAGPHLNPAVASHPSHAGDMPVLLVNSDGRAAAQFYTDRFTLRDLRDLDGGAVIVHGLPDNYANIPTARYDPDPDATTRSTGDAGDRIACGVVR